MSQWTYLHERAEFICICGIGHYPVWKDILTNDPELTIHGCCPRNCCISGSFPGQQPRRGDIALCGKGSLGLVLHPARQRITYPNKQEGLAWIGYHLTNAISPVGAQWSSRNPCILGNIAQFAFTKNNNVDWAATLFELAKTNAVSGWNWKPHRTSITPATEKLIADMVQNCIEE